MNKRGFFKAAMAGIAGLFALSSEAGERIKRAYITIRYNRTDTQYGIANGHIEMHDEDKNMTVVLEFANGDVIHKNEIDWTSVGWNHRLGKTDYVPALITPSESVLATKLIKDW